MKYSFDIEISSACNLSCINCAYNKSISKKQFMTLENFINIQKHIEAQFPQNRSISLIGLGEQTLHPQFSIIVDNLKSGMKKDLFISTNGTTLKELYNDLNKFDYVSVSVDAISSLVYNKVRPGFDFDRLVQSFSLLRPLKIKQSSFVINEDNAHEAKDFIAFSLDHGFNRIYFEIANSPWHQNHKDLKPLWLELQHFVKKQNLDHFVSFQKPTSRICDYVSTIIKIGVNGNIRICPFIDKEGAEFLAKSSVWIDAQNKFLLKQIELGKMKECFTCNHRGLASLKVD